MPADQMAHETVPLLDMILLVGTMGALDRHLLGLLMQRRSVSQPAASRGGCDCLATMKRVRAAAGAQLQRGL